MKNHHLPLLILLLLGLFFSGCISLNVGQNKSLKSKDVKFENPSGNFKEIDSQGSDKAWQSSSTANTISFLSDCNGNDPSLENMQAESISGLEEVQIVSSDKTTFEQREALQSKIKGKLDGVTVEMQFLFFKKNGCNYTLSYGGRSSKFKEEQGIFNTFTQSFKVP